MSWGDFAKALAAPVGAVAGGLIGGPAGAMIGGQLGGAVSGAFGSSSTTTGIQLAKGMEALMLDDYDKGLKQYDQNISKLKQQRDLYDAKITQLQNVVDSTIPSPKALKELTNINMNIAKTSGLSAQELIDNGYLTSDEVSSMEQLREMEDVNKNMEDPRLMQEIQNQRSQLEQDLAMRGVSGSIRAQQLAQFDQEAQMRIRTRSDELRQTQVGLISGRLGLASDLRSSNLDDVMNQYGMSVGGLTLARQGISQSAGMSADRATMSQNFAGALNQQTQGKMGMHAEGGRYILSSGAKKELEKRYGKPGETPAQRSAKEAAKQKEKAAQAEANKALIDKARQHFSGSNWMLNSGNAYFNNVKQTQAQKTRKVLR